MKKLNQYVDVEISEFSKKGNGIGFFTKENGTSCKIEVPFTMPGDVVKVLINRKKGGVFTGKLDSFIKQASSRVQPKCDHFATCGGCRFQHLSYETQIKNKEAVVHGLFQGLISDNVKVYPIIKAPSPWEYRNKMEYSFSSDAAGNKYLGLIMDASRGKVLNLTECHLTNPWFIEALKAVRQWWEGSDLEAYHTPRNSGSLRTLTVREGISTGDRLVMLTVSGNPDFALHRQHLDSFIHALKESVQPDSIFLRIQQIAKGVETSFYEMHLHGKDHISEILNISIHENAAPTPIHFAVSPTAFFQPNTKQAEKLYSKALELANLSKEDVVYDLYCGTGTLGICIARHVKGVIGIEISAESSLDARENAKKNGLENVTIYTGDVFKVLKEKTLPKPNVLLLDPPRAGLEPGALQEILALNAEKIVYISCNPETQSKNVEQLVAAGYKLLALQPVDQFPQTAHIENIVLLKK